MTATEQGRGEQPGALRRNVRRLRDEAGLTREQLAARSEVTVSTIARIESDDDYEPRMSSVRSIAGGLGVRLADLFTDPGTTPDDEPNGDTKPEARAS